MQVSSPSFLSIKWAHGPSIIIHVVCAIHIHVRYYHAHSSNSLVLLRFRTANSAGHVKILPRTIFASAQKLSYDVPLGLTGEETTVRELLRARKYRTGKDFYMSSAVGRPKSQQDERIRRMRMVVTHMDMYGTHYMNDNRWSMGPFYTEERGRRNLHRLL
jgi:hypothetical protein